MVTKTELLEKLSLEQLREVAFAEDVQLPDGASREEVTRSLLKLPMQRIREYVAEYSEEKQHAHRPPKKPKVPETLEIPKISGYGPEIAKEISRITSEFKDVGKEIARLAREKLSEAQIGDVLHELKDSKAQPSNGDTLESAGVGEQATTVSKTEDSGVLPNRVSTGFEMLDSLLLGGIPQNYAVILTSPSCDERELLIKRFLEAGAKEGQITFHVTIEASDVKALAEEFQSNFYLFVCNPQANSIIKTLPNVFKLKGVDNLNEINIALTTAFRKLDSTLKGPRRACIEIISDVLLQHHAPSIRKWLAALIPELKARGFTILAVMNPYMHPSEEVQAILDLFQGEISIRAEKTRRGDEKRLKVSKMYNQRYLEHEIPLRKMRL